MNAYIPKEMKTTEPPATKPSPIFAELTELSMAVENTEKAIHSLRDRLLPICQQVEKPKLPSNSVEPSSGCELKDRLAAIKCSVLYIKQLITEAEERCWL